jgi:hypothetical protein
MNKFYIETSGGHVEEIEKAFLYAVNLAKADKEVRRIIFYSFTKSNFMQVNMYFKNLIGRCLTADGFKISGMDVLVKCETRITYNKQYSNDKTDVVIACHMSSKDIYALDDDAKTKYIVAIPWMEHDVDEWVRRWNAIEISGENKEKPVEKVINPLLPVALYEMDVNMFETKSLSHQSDEETCKTYIRVIHKHLPDISPEDIENYLVRELSWTAENAHKVGELLGRLKAQRTFQGGAKTGLQDYYKRWKNKLNDK